MALDGEGFPACLEIWFGNIADVTTLQQVAYRLQHRFRTRSVCLLTDRGRISAVTLRAIEARGWQFILGARPHASKEERERVLAYPVEARRDATAREEMVAELEKNLATAGAKSLVGNRGYRRYLVARGTGFALNRKKIREEEKFNGIWVLRTNTATDAAAALKCPKLWCVEQVFPTAQALLDTGPIFHKLDETICGHALCSFLALVQQTELFWRLARDGESFERKRALQDRDLDVLTKTVVEQVRKRFVLRRRSQGCCGKVACFVALRLPAAIRQEDPQRRPRIRCELNRTLPAETVVPTRTWW